MCIPHGVINTWKSGGRVKREKVPKKSLDRVSKDQFEKGDPDFKDERITKEQTEGSEKKGWLASLLGD